MTNVQRLRSKWENRDRYYSVRRIHGIKAPLTEREVAAVRMGRALEVEGLPEKDRPAAYAELDRWVAPEVFDV